MLLEKIYDSVAWIETAYGLQGLVLRGLGAALAVAVIAYLCGCFNGAVIVSKYILRNDVRNHGSGNAGLTNFYRTFGGPLTLLVILTDVLKAVVAVLVGTWILGGLIGHGNAHMILVGKYWAALFCLLGHMYPCMFGFKGGKGILSGGTIAIMLDWRIAVFVWGLFLVAVVCTRYISLGSCCAAAGFPVGTWLVYGDLFSLCIAAFLGGFIIWKHRANLQRLAAGTESKFSLHKKKEADK